MSIFTRFKDIVTSNINAMLDRAEDPEKLLRLMIQEMEDTLVELKASCASVMADRARALRGRDTIEARIREWNSRAELAMDRGREDLAREALVQKRTLQGEVDRLNEEVASLEGVVGRYHDDIQQLEEKLTQARNKQRVLVQRHTLAVNRNAAQTKIRNVDNSDVLLRFDSFEQRIDRMEAEADLVNYKRKPELEEEFERLQGDEQLENELAELRSKVRGPKAE